MELSHVVLGDSRTCVKELNDSDDLWTSMSLSSQIFRYNVTQNSTIKISAWMPFDALELLNNVTGISGYAARSMAKRTDFPPGPRWNVFPVSPTLQYKGDTSSDEAVGYEFVYSLVPRSKNHNVRFHQI